MIKIEIKTPLGKVLFEYESTDNTLKKTLEKAAKEKADLGGAYLRGADLRGADLGGADLGGADLGGAYLGGADLGGADLRGADLRGADLGGAYLGGADLRGAYLRGAYLGGAYLGGADLGGAYLRGHKIKNAAVFTGLYEYVVIPLITEEGEERVVMGCHNRSVKEWEENFWNNDNEFPNNNSLKSNLRLMAYQTAKAWLKLAQA